MIRIKFYTIEEALSINAKEVKELHKKFLNPSLVNMMSLINFDRVYNSALGSLVKDIQGKEYIDFLGGYGSLNLGHNHPKVLEAIEKVKGLPNILQTSLGRLNGVLAHNLSKLTSGELQICFFGNSGAEAVEGALKLAKIATGKSKIVYCEGSFHGKTLGALTVTGREKYKKPFVPLLPDCESVPYGDTLALEEKLSQKDVAAFIVEPIQGEGGIIVPSKGYLKKVKELCEQYDALLIIDEIQTGLGRTGRMFACNHDDVMPDIMCLAKSLGGGIMPIGAYMTKETIFRKAYGTIEKATLHTSTFGGNTLACAAGIASLNIILEEGLAKQAEQKGKYLMDNLLLLKEKYPIIKDIRGKGLMIGIELAGNEKNILNKISAGLINNLSQEYFASLVAGTLLSDYGIITAYTLNNPNVIRVEPPLNIEYKYLDLFIRALDEIFNNNKSFLKLVLTNVKNMI